MPEIYASWCKGILEDFVSLSLLKESNLIEGIELSNLSDSLELLNSVGLKYNQHNALRDYKLGLENEYFIPTMNKFSEVVKRCKESGPSVVGFHAGYSAVNEKNVLSQTVISNSLRSLNFLDKVLDKKIIFETPPYHPTLFVNGNQSALSVVSSSEFVKQIFSKSRAGYLFDISHIFVTAAAKIQRGEFNGEIEDYFAQMISVCATETYQLHLNVPTYSKENGFTDSHGVIKLNNSLGKRILLIAKEIVDSCPNLKLITLEMEPNLAPKKHAKLMIAQAKLVEKELLRK